MSLDILVLGLNYAPEHTGIAPYTRDTARALAEAGHSVHVVTGLPHYPQWTVHDGYGQSRRHEEQDGAVRVTRLRHPVPADPTGAGRILMEARFAAAAAAVGHRDPDVVLAVSPALLTVAAAIRHRVGRRRRPALGVIVQDLYGSAVAEAGVLGGRAGGAVARLERTLLSRADGVVAVHEAFRPTLERYGIPADRTTIIRNWTHIRPGAAGDTAVLRDRLDWPTNRTVALHAGNMGAKQGLENVIAAARHAESHDLPVEFVLLGDGNQRSHLQASAAGCSRIRFVDPLPEGEFVTALAAADVLLLNERGTVREMCVPSKLTSYFATGRPVVAATFTDSPAAREVRASGAGVVVEPDAPTQLLDGIARMAGDAGRAAGGRGPGYADEMCSSTTALAEYVNWVEGLAARHCSKQS